MFEILSLAVIKKSLQLLKNPKHVAYVATVPCERLNVRKQAINDKLQGSVRYDTRCYVNV